MSEDDYFLGWRFITPNSVWRHRATGWQFPASANQHSVHCRRSFQDLSMGRFQDKRTSPTSSTSAVSLAKAISRPDASRCASRVQLGFGLSSKPSLSRTLLGKRQHVAATVLQNRVMKCPVDHKCHPQRQHAETPPSQKYSISPNKRPKRRKR